MTKRPDAAPPKGKPTIAELEAMIEDGAEPEIAPDGTVTVEHPKVHRLEDILDDAAPPKETVYDRVEDAIGASRDPDRKWGDAPPPSDAAPVACPTCKADIASRAAHFAKTLAAKIKQLETERCALAGQAQRLYAHPRPDNEDASPIASIPGFLSPCHACGFTGCCSAHQHGQDPTCQTCFGERAHPEDAPGGPWRAEPEGNGSPWWNIVTDDENLGSGFTEKIAWVLANALNREVRDKGKTDG